MASKARVQVVAASREARVERFFWRTSLTVFVAVGLMLALAGLAHAQSAWVRPAPPLVGYVGSSSTPHLCQRTAPLDEGCWLGLDAQRAIDQVCALHGDVRASNAQLPTGQSHFAAEVQCATAKVGIVAQ